MAASNDLTSLPTPAACIADFCLIPIGTPTASVSKEVASVQRLLQQSGLTYSMHSAGTTVGMRTLYTAAQDGIFFPHVDSVNEGGANAYFTEGSWEQVMRVIGQCHSMVHGNGVVRIQSDIRVGSRTDKKQGMRDKVAAVERLLEEDK
jgi:uncharacterized protein YqgV (UPF0045/DUF77 family)